MRLGNFSMEPPRLVPLTVKDGVVTPGDCCYIGDEFLVCGHRKERSEWFWDRTGSEPPLWSDSDRLASLSGRILACSCGAGKKCHGRLLINKWNEAFAGKRREQKEEVPSSKSPRKQYRTQETHPEGISKCPWPPIHHGWNADSIFLDEVGRGSLMGPLYVGGVVLLPGFNVMGLHDSKLLKEHEREALYEQLSTSPHLLWHVEPVPNTEIDRLGIDEAWRVGIRNTIRTLAEKARGVEGLLLVRAVLDGDKGVSNTVLPVETVVQGDRAFAGISAASILAKVARDRYMVSIADQYPEFAAIIRQGKGYFYGKVHKDLILAGKYTELHRRSFNPLKNFLNPPVTFRRHD